MLRFVHCRLSIMGVRLVWVLAVQLSCAGQAGADFILGTATNLGRPINTSSVDQSPSLSADGLRLYYGSGGYVGEPSQSSADFWVATRESVDDPWGTPTQLGSPINSSAFEANVDISADDLSLYFSDGIADVQGTVRPGGLGRPDLWMSTRASPGDAWGEPVNLVSVNSRWYDTSPSITADGLSLFFDSSRPGGEGSYDIWMATRPTVDDDWGEPVPLGATVNHNGIDRAPAISADGLTLLYSSLRPGGLGAADIWVTTRPSRDDPWREPVNLGRKVNGNSGAWDLDPSLSYDGSTLHFTTWQSATWPGSGQFDIWQIPLLPFESVPLSGSGDTYSQDFDEALGIDGSLTGTPLPPGWTSSDNGVIHENATTKSFPASSSLGAGMPIYNAGGDQAADRALAVGVTGKSEVAILQLLADVTDFDATSFQLRFDVEAWDAARRGVDLPGEAAFDLTVELDAGNGFTQLADLDTVTTGATLLPPARDFLDGNAAANRISFDTGRVSASIPADSKLRIRWTANKDGQTTGWVYGLDNVELSVFGESPVALQAGDADQDLDFDQFDLVQVQQAAKYLTGERATWGEGDWDGAPGGTQGNPPAGDGLFNQFDIVAAQQAAKYLSGPYAAIQPDGHEGDGQTSVGYDASSGEVWVDAPAGKELTSMNIDSAARIFIGQPAQNLGGSFDNDADSNIFKATFGSSFGSLSFGNVARTGLEKQFLLNDLTVVGSLAGGGDLGRVDLIYVPVPEPSALVLLVLGLASLSAVVCRGRTTTTVQ